MVCPYCDGRNPPGEAVCKHCGAILRGASKRKKNSAAKTKSSSTTSLLLIILAIALLGAAIGSHAAPHLRYHISILGAAVGLVVGAALGAIIGGGKALYLSNLYRARHAALSRKINGAMTAAAERYELELQKPDASPQTRLQLAAWNLLNNEPDKALQALQNAQKFGAAGVEFENNAGAALCMRGSSPQSLSHYEKAVQDQSAPAQPFANMARVYLEDLSDPDASAHMLTAIGGALKREPKNPDFCALLGAAFERDERYPEAEKQVQQAQKLSEGSPSSQSDCSVNLGALCFRQGDLKEAQRYMQSAIALDSGNARAISNFGLLQIQAKEREQGLVRLRQAALVDPRLASAHAALGFGFCRLGFQNDGIRASHEALTYDPNLFEPHANLGKAYMDAGLPDVAEHYLKNALKLQPRSWEAMQTMGVVEIALGNIEAARQQFDKAAGIKPLSTEIMLGQAVAYALLGRDADAQRRIDAARRLDPDNPMIIGHQAWLFLRMASSSSAAAEIEIALARLPKNAILSNNFGLAQVDLGAYETALDYLLKALNLDPNLHPVHYHIGSVYALLKQPDDAIKSWEIAGKYEHNNPDCFANLGAAYYRRGDYDHAVTNFRRVLSMRQDRPEDYSNLGLTYAKQGVALRKKADNVSKATQIIVRNNDEKLNLAFDKHRQAIEMFDKALLMTPTNVILHSNRGLACYFANRPEEAMREWGEVTRIDPLYVRRRGARVQSEFDDTQVDFIPLDIPKRAIMLPLQTSDYVFRLSWGYDINQWRLIISDPALESTPSQIRQLEAIERMQRALKL